MISIRCQGKRFDVTAQNECAVYSVDGDGTRGKHYRTIREGLTAMIGDNISAEVILQQWLATDKIPASDFRTLIKRLKRETEELNSGGHVMRGAIVTSPMNRRFSMSDRAKPLTQHLLTTRLATAQEIAEHRPSYTLGRAWIVKDSFMPHRDRVFPNHQLAQIHFTIRYKYYRGIVC